MEQGNIDDLLRSFEQQEDNWQRLSFNLRRHLDLWSFDHVKPEWGDFKLTYWPVICNISVDGSTVTEIANKAFVVKQNMSRTIKELEQKGLITSSTSEKDKRSELLILTAAGKQFVAEASTEVAKLNEKYKEMVGEEDLQTAVRVLNKIINYHRMEQETGTGTAES